MSISVLFVDDDPGISRLMEIYLSKVYEFQRAGSAQDAMQAMSQADYQVVVLDLSLPDRSGLEVLSAIKQAAPDTKVLIMTGDSGHDTRQKALSLGAEDVIVKPISPANLQDMINNLV
jgi:DNA-binding NtrC family response regulator